MGVTLWKRLHLLEHSHLIVAVTLFFVFRLCGDHSLKIQFHLCCQNNAYVTI